MSKKESQANVSPAALKAIWKEISPSDWLSILEEHRPNHNWVLSGDTIKGLCIYHADTSPSLTINLEKGFVHCFGGSCQAHEWNPVQFFAKVSNSAYGAALRSLKSRFGIKLPPSYFNNVQKIEDNNDVKRILQQALNTELVEALHHSDLARYNYAERSGFFGWFRKRNFPEDSAHLWPIGILPPRELLYERLSENSAWAKQQEAAISYMTAYLNTPGMPSVHEGSLVYFFYTSPTTIGRMRIRHAGSKDFYAVEDPYDEKVGLFGFNMFSHLLGNIGKRPLCVVEGEMDALALISHQASSGLDNLCVVATGGTMEHDLDQLSEFGFDRVYAIPDNDAEGLGWAKNLLANNKKVSRVFRWSPNDSTLKVKDVDEAIRAYGFDNFYKRLCKTTDFPKSHDWVSEQLESELKAIPADELEARHTKAADWGRGIQEPSQRAAFIDDVVKLYGLNKELLLQAFQDDETEDGFVSKLAYHLRSKEYHFLQQKSVGQSNSTVIMAWSRRKNVIRNFNMTSIAHTRAAAEADLGRLDEYVRNELGEPPFLQYKLNNQGNPIALAFPYKMQLIGQYFQQAIVTALGESIHESRMTELGQGVHYVKNFEDDKPAILIVNGTKCFKGSFVNNNTEVVYTELESPIAGNYYFRLQNSPWSPNLKSVKDIESGSKVDVKAVFEKLTEVLQVGWRFKNHELESRFLAADIMYTPVAAVFEYMVLVDVRGETHSGKSTLMQVMGGPKFPDLKLCEPCLYIADFSAAAIRQLHSCQALRLILDEFEDENIATGGRLSKRGNSVRDSLQMFRTLSSGSPTIRGSSSGEVQQTKLYFPLTVGGIYTMQEVVDVNRYTHISLRRIEGFGDAISHLRSKFSSKELAALRRDVTLCFLTRIPQVIKEHEDIKKEFSGNSKLPTGSLERQHANFYPAATIMKIAGLDYQKFLVEFCTTKFEELKEEGGTKRDSEIVWEHLLHTQINLNHCGVSDVGGLASLAILLANPSTRPIFHETDLGVYLIEDKNWLVVFWHKAVPGILKNSSRYRNTAYAGRVKLIADGDPRVIPKEKLKRSNFLKREVWGRVGARISYEDISVFDLNGTIEFDAKGASEELESDAADRHRLMEDIPDTVVDAKVRRGEFEI